MPVFLNVKVIPGAGKKEIKIDENRIIKISLSCPPEKGRANKELIKVLSKITKIPQQDFFIVKGKASRSKLIKIETEKSKGDIFKTLFGDLGNRKL